MNGMMSQWMAGVWVELDYSAKPVGITASLEKEAGHPGIRVHKNGDELVITLVDGLEQITIQDLSSRKIQPPGSWLLVAYGDVPQAGQYLQSYTTGYTNWTKDMGKALCWHTEAEALQQAANWGFSTEDGDDLYVEAYELIQVVDS